MMRNVDIFLSAQGEDIRAGVLTLETSRGAQTVSIFRYDQDYLATPGLPPLSPEMPRDSSAPFLQPGLPLALLDAGPDRWGRHLIRRYLTQRAQSEKAATPEFTDALYVLEASDATRQGALRIHDGEHFISEAVTEVPGVALLEDLAASAEALASGDDAVVVTSRLVAAGGTGGGMQPKVAVQDAGALYVAKFPRLDEVTGNYGTNWEMLAAELAEEAGITVPEHRLYPMAAYDAFLSRRFDRGPDERERIAYWSARTALEARNEEGTYTDIRDFLEESGADPDTDLPELWRRIVFSLVIGNTDDHLRNHGLLWTNFGWRLSPAFDLNPTVGGSTKVLSLELAPGVDVGSLTVLQDAAADYRVSDPHREFERIAAVVEKWPECADRCRIPSNTRAEMAENFERGLRAIADV